MCLFLPYIHYICILFAIDVYALVIGFGPLKKNDRWKYYSRVLELELWSNSWEEIYPNFRAKRFSGEVQSRTYNLVWSRTTFTKEWNYHGRTKRSLSSTKVCSAPCPSGHSFSIYKFFFTQVPKLMLAAVNQAIFVPNLLHSKTFEWMLERRVIFICIM